MRKFTSKRSALLAIVGVLAMSAAAIAYWTTAGTGSGSGSIGSQPATGVDLDGTAVSFPNLGATDTSTVTVTNTTASSTRVDDVSITGITSDKAGCDTATNPDWFSYAPSVAVDERIAAGASTSVGYGVQLVDSVENQDVCQGATLTLNLASTSS